MEQQRPHRNGCPQNTRDIESGFTDEGEGRAFVARYNINLKFRIQCLGCCLDYLVADREYQQTEGSFDRVYFTVQDPDHVADVSCIVREPSGPTGVHGQIATGRDYNLGERLAQCAVDAGRKYQFYSLAGSRGPARLSVGTAVTARMESFAINQASQGCAELAEIYVNYADAALIELYRVQHDPMPSLKGICTLTPVHNVNVARINFRDDIKGRSSKAKTKASSATAT